MSRLFHLFCLILSAKDVHSTCSKINFQSGKRLENKLIYKNVSTRIGLCLQLCSRLPHCASINYNSISGICCVNYAADGVFVTDSGSTFLVFSDYGSTTQDPCSVRPCTGSQQCWPAGLTYICIYTGIMVGHPCSVDPSVCDSLTNSECSDGETPVCLCIAGYTTMDGQTCSQILGSSCSVDTALCLSVTNSECSGDTAPMCACMTGFGSSEDGLSCEEDEEGIATTSGPVDVPTCSDSSGTLMRDPADCQHYFECANGILYERSCPGVLVFNPDAQYCDYLENVPICQR